MQEDLRKLFESQKVIVWATNLGPYAEPHMHVDTSIQELEHLLELRILENKGTSEWALPTFIIPKKNSKVRLINNLQ